MDRLDDVDTDDDVDTELEVDTLDDVDTDDDVDTELEVDTLDDVEIDDEVETELVVEILKRIKVDYYHIKMKISLPSGCKKRNTYITWKIFKRLILGHTFSHFQQSSYQDLGHFGETFKPTKRELQCRDVPSNSFSEPLRVNRYNDEKIT